MAVGIIEKGNSGLFENEIEFRGKYATMVRYLKEEIGLFNSFREAYIICSILGFLNNRMETNTEQDKVQAASILPSEISKRKKDLRYLYRLIMLLKEESEFTLDDYKNRTFRDDVEENMETIKSNMAMFNSYACGGLEIIYEKFVDSNRIEDTVNLLYEYVHGFSAEVGILDEDELPDFEPEYN